MAPMKEHQHIEWKESWRDEYLKWICGFANAEGGILVIGRNDKGEVVGLPNAAKLMEDIPNKVRDVLGIVANVRLKKQQGKEYIEIAVTPYPSPISYKGEYHYRSGSTKQELKGVALERFLLKKRGRHWDDAPEPAFTVRSCSAAAMRLFKQKAAESGRMDVAVLRDGREAVLGNLELTERHGLKRAACLLFCDRPEQYVSGAWIKVGFFLTDDNLRYQDEVHGNLFEQVDKTLELLHTSTSRRTSTTKGSSGSNVFFTLGTRCARRCSTPWSTKITAAGSPSRSACTRTGSSFGIRGCCRRTGRWSDCWASTRLGRSIPCWRMPFSGLATLNPGDAASKR